MSGERSARQAAHNEVVFRDANERLLARVEELGTAIPQTPFLCECERETCTTVVRVTLDEYARARADARTFLLAPGHEEGLESAEPRERNDRFVIVEKVGRMGALAEQEEARRRDG